MAAVNLVIQASELPPPGTDRVNGIRIDGECRTDTEIGMDKLWNSVLERWTIVMHYKNCQGFDTLT